MLRTNRSTVCALALTISLGALAATGASAQDQRPDDQARHDDQGRPEHRAHDEGQRDDHNGDADRYRKDHPHAAARCHDGFFTNTNDRGRACSKHGGIDVWLRE
jgi:hypothetical protein